MAGYFIFDGKIRFGTIDESRTSYDGYENVHYFATINGVFEKLPSCKTYPTFEEAETVLRTIQERCKNQRRRKLNETINP